MTDHSKKLLVLFCLALFCFLEACTDSYIPSIKPPPQDATIGRIDGVFSYTTPSQQVSGQDQSWDCILLRFYPDGYVLTTLVLLNKQDVNVSWPSINKWFNREKIQIENHYYVLDDKIWFRTKGRTGNQHYVPIIDWWGTLTGQRMILSSFSHKTKYERKNVEFVRLQIK